MSHKLLKFLNLSRSSNFVKNSRTSIISSFAKVSKLVEKMGKDNQEGNYKERPVAPWGNSTFEAEARDFSPSSEYSTTYYVKARFYDDS